MVNIETVTTLLSPNLTRICWGDRDLMCRRSVEVADCEVRCKRFAKEDSIIDEEDFYRNFIIPALSY